MTRRTLAILSLALMLPALAAAQINMPNPSEISGVPLPSTDVPAGTVSVRVIRGDFSKNIAGQRVDFTVDGRTETGTTDAEGRAQVSGLRPGAVVMAVAVVDGERLESQPITVGASGIRVVLVATDPEMTARAEADRALAAGPAAKGFVVLGPETRIIAELRRDDLSVFYVLQIMNAARVPVDTGGPLIFDLPDEARGATILEGSSPQATAIGSRVIVTGPFAPGATDVQVAFGMPSSAGRVAIRQVWPATLQQLTVLATQAGGLDISSAQFSNKRQVSSDGQPVILGTGSTIPAGQALDLEITGVPYHARWPRLVALSLAGVFVALGLWGAFVSRPRRATA
jgi:hypothetical protein